MTALRVVSRIVTGLYFLSFVCLLLTTHALREMAGIASYGFLVMLAVSVLMSAIKWRCRQRWKRRALEDQVCRHGLAGPEHRRVGLDRTKIDLKPECGGADFARAALRRSGSPRWRTMGHWRKW